MPKAAKAKGGKPPGKPKTPKASVGVPGDVDAHYAAGAGSNLSQKDANLLGPVIRDLIAQHGGEADHLPDKLVEAAAPVNSPAHAYFEWDDAKAGIEYRRTQAQRLIRSIVIQYKTYSGGKPDTGRVRAFHVVTRKPTESTKDDATEAPRPVSVYVGLQTVVESDEYRQEVIDRARREFLALRARYDFYKKKFPEFATTFGPLWAILEQLEAE